MAFIPDEQLFYEMMDPCQFMHWDKEDRPYHMMGGFMDSDSDSDGIPGEILSQIVKTQKALKSRQLCRYYQKGNCRYGNRCRYVHEYSEYSESSDELMDQCKFFQKGYCRYGESCHFKHTNNNQPMRTAPTARKPANTAVSMSNQMFSPTDEDLKEGRLTRVRLCQDVSIKGAVKNENPKDHGAYYIEVFVDKREDTVQYLYDVLVEKAQHPLYQIGSFIFSKPNTNCDFSDRSKKLKDSSLFIFGNCVEVLINQSFKLAAKVLSRKDICIDRRRYPMSTLPRNEDGSFKEGNLKALLKVFPQPESKEDACRVTGSREESEEAGIDDEPAKVLILSESLGRAIRNHNETDCKWCTDRGCDCLEAVCDDVESDDSEMSCQSRKSDKKRQAKASVTKKRHHCGVYPDTLKLKDLPSSLALKFGDIIKFDEFPTVTAYVVGKEDTLIQMDVGDSVVVPFEVSTCFKDPIANYRKVIADKSSDMASMLSVYLRHDDQLLVKAFGNGLPASWRYCVSADFGETITDLGSAGIVDIEIEFGDKKHFSVTAPTHRDAKQTLSMICFADMWQR